MEIKDGYLYFETKATVQTKKKITGHSFVDLCGLNPYNKRGDAVLSLLKLYTPDFDEKYRYRGDMAEKIVAHLLQKNNLEYIYYTEEDKKKNNYDFYQQYSQCGGIPDFLLRKLGIVIEVKSKSLSKYNDVIGNPPKEEVYQGLYYGFLDSLPTTRLIWVFFDEETEKEIFAGKKPTTLKNIKIFSKDYHVDKEEIKGMLYEALLYYSKCVSEKRIPLVDISYNVLKALGLNGGNNEHGL